MTFLILYYRDEPSSREMSYAAMTKLDAVRERLKRYGKLALSAQLTPREPSGTTASRSDLHGFFLIDCNAREEASDIVHALARADDGGRFEIRNVAFLDRGERPPPYTHLSENNSN